MNAEELLDNIHTQRIKWVQLQFPDVNGTLKAKTIGAQTLTVNMLKEGIIEGDVAGLFSEFGVNDLILVPRTETYGTLPWGAETARMLAKVKKGKDERYLKDSMYPLERAQAAFETAGKGRLAVTQEVKFYFTDGITIDTTPGREAITFNSKEAKWNPAALKSASGFAFATDPQDAYSLVRQQIADSLNTAFAYVVSGHSHGSVAAQQKISLDQLSPLEAADAFATLKLVARAAGMVNLAIPTFMALPFSADDGAVPNGYRLSFSSYLKGSNVFYDATDKHGLSQLAYYFIGGILEHAEALSLFTNPTVNSHKRLWVEPKYSSAGVGDAHNSVDINPSKRDFHITLQSPDPLVNPYLMLAAVIAAGVYGIKKKTQADILSDSPLVLSESTRKRHHATELPRTVSDAVSALDSDNEFLNGIFSTDIVYAYTELRVHENKEANFRPSTYEYMKYFHF